MSTPNLRPLSGPDRRRSQRVFLAVPLSITGQNNHGAAFVENSSALLVSAHGGLILLKAVVSAGQRLALTNLTTNEHISGIVIRVHPAKGDASEIAVEFEQPSARFWCISFPPVDWSPHSPEAKRYTSATQLPAAANTTLIKK